MERVIQTIKASYGTDISLTVSALLAFIMALAYRKKHPFLDHFYLYPLLSFIDSALMFIILLLFPKEPADYRTTFLVNSIFMLFEFFSLLLIQRNKLLKKYNSTFTISITISYLITFLVHFTQGWEINSMHKFYLIQNLFIVILGAKYILSIFSSQNEASILKDPVFIITIGSLTMAICTSPIFIASDYIFSPKGKLFAGIVYVINNFFYILYFIIIIIAFLCPKTKES